MRANRQEGEDAQKCTLKRRLRSLLFIQESILWSVASLSDNPGPLSHNDFWIRLLKSRGT